MKRFPTRSLLISALLALGCGSPEGDGFTVDPDAAVGDDVTDDFGAPPTFDVQPLDRGQPPQDDGVRPPVDVSRPDVQAIMDTGFPTADTGGGTGGVCPASCATSADCDPCWRTGEMRVGEYCCSMGLCIYSSMTCGSTTTPPGGGGDGGLDGGGGADASGGFDIPEVGLDFDAGGG